MRVTVRGAGVAAGVIAAVGVVGGLVLKQKRKKEAREFDEGYAKVMGALKPEDQRELELAMEYLDDFLRSCDDLLKIKDFCDVLAKSIFFDITPTEARKEMLAILGASGLPPLQSMASAEGIGIYANILEKHQRVSLAN